MNILVVNFPLRPDSPKKLFPVGLGYITTAIKNAGFAFDLLDMDANREDTIIGFLNKKTYDVVCVGSLVTGYKKIKEFCEIIREANPKSIIIAGNSVATSIPEMLLKNTEVDIAVMLEGDQTIVDLLECVDSGEEISKVSGIWFKKDGVICKTPDRVLIDNISMLPLIDFDIFDIGKYIEVSKLNISDPSVIDGEVRALPISTARGCINNCTFCYHVFKGKKYRYRGADSVANDIHRLIQSYGINYVMFWDELTFFSKKQANDLVDEILNRGLKVSWMARCRANLFDNDGDLEILKKMKAAGCCGVQFSLENADPNILKAMKKNINADQFERQCRLFDKVGLRKWTSLVLGYPAETPETIRKTIDTCIRNNLYPSTGFLLPQPGSQMYEYAIKMGFITNEEEYICQMGDRQDLSINMTKMSDEEFRSVVQNELERCGRELNMNLDSKKLLKTGNIIVREK